MQIIKDVGVAGRRRWGWALGWSIELTVDNTGNTTLTDLEVTDSRGRRRSIVRAGVPLTATIA